MATNGRKRYFHIDENAGSEQIYPLLNAVESADEDNVDNLMNISATEFIAEEENYTSSWKHSTLPWTTPEANLHVIPSDNQSKERQNNNKQELWKWNKEVKVTKQKECHLVPEK